MPAPHPASNKTSAITTSVGPNCESRGWTAQCRSVVKNNTGETVDVDIWYDAGVEAWAWCTHVPDGANATMKGHWYRYQTTAYHPGGSVVARSGLHGMSAFFKLVKIDGCFAFLASSEQEVDRLIYDRLELKALGGRYLGVVQVVSSTSSMLHCDAAERLSFKKTKLFQKKNQDFEGSSFQLFEHGEGDYSLRTARGTFINLEPAGEVDALDEAFAVQASTFNLLCIEKTGDKYAIKSRMSQRYLAASKDGLAKATNTSGARESFNITMEGAALPMFGTEVVQTPEDFWQGVKRLDPRPYRVIMCTTSQETLYLALFYTDVYQIHVHVEDDDQVAAAHVKRMSGDQRSMINLLDAKHILIEWRRTGVPFVGPNGRLLQLPNMSMSKRDLRLLGSDIWPWRQRLQMSSLGSAVNSDGGDSPEERAALNQLLTSFQEINNLSTSDNLNKLERRVESQIKLLRSYAAKKGLTLPEPRSAVLAGLAAASSTGTPSTPEDGTLKPVLEGGPGPPRLQWQNWGKTIPFQMAFETDFMHPKTADEVASIVKKAVADRMCVRCIGHGHSWTPVAFGEADKTRQQPFVPGPTTPTIITWPTPFPCVLPMPSRVRATFPPCLFTMQATRSP